MLLLSDIVKKITVEIGQIQTPISLFGYDTEKLLDIFQLTLSDYEKYRPFLKRVILPLNQSGTSIPDCLRVKSIRLNTPGFNETVRPLDFKLWELDDNNFLKTTLAGNYYVEYLARYTLTHLLVYETNINYITSYEDTTSFYLKDSFKKGTLNISLTDINSTITYNCSDDLGSYQNYSSNFTVNIGSDILTILEATGKKLKTGTQIKFTNTGGALPTVLNPDDNFYVIRQSDTTIKVANTLQNALDNISLDFTDIGTGTHTLITQITLPNVNILGTLATGNYNSQTNKVSLNLLDSFEGELNANYRTANKGCENLSLDDTLFLKLFKANFQISLAFNKENLKLPDLPWDFSFDNLIGDGQRIRDNILEKELPDKSKWYLFR